MSIFRSEDMGLYTLSVDKNFAWDLMDSLGRLSCLHFVDVNNKEQLYHRPYSSMLRRCDDAVRRIRYMETLCEKYNKRLRPPSSVEGFQANLQQSIMSQGLDPMAYFEKLEVALEDAEKFLAQQLRDAETFYSQYISVVQHRYVLNKASEIVLARARYDS